MNGSSASDPVERIGTIVGLVCLMLAAGFWCWHVVAPNHSLWFLPPYRLVFISSYHQAYLQASRDGWEVIREDITTALAIVCGVMAVLAFIGSLCGDKQLKLPPPEVFFPTSPPQPDLAKQAGLLAPEGIPIGWKDRKLYGPPDIQQLLYDGDRHLITFGPIGSGKNTTAQTPALLDPLNDASALVIDVKGQLCAITTRRRRQMGHTVAALNPFAVLGIPSVSYNPLSHLDGESVTFVSDCERIAEGLVDQKKADHWEVSALDYVTLLVMWVKLFENDKSIVRVWQLLGLPEEQRIMQCEIMAQCSYAPIAEGAGRYTSKRGEVEDSIQTARAQVGFLRDPAIQTILRGGPNEISFAELKRRKMTIFLIIPPDLLHTRGKFLRLLVQAALGEMIRERTQPAKPVLFMLDEFAQLGTLSMIENAASIVRDYKIRLWLILQNLPQLKALYDEKWESFLSSAGVVQVFTPNELTTAKYFSERSGVETIQRKSISSGTSSGPSGGSSSSGTSYTEMDEPLYRVQEILDLPAGAQLLFCPGLSKAIWAVRLPYNRDPGYFYNGQYQGEWTNGRYQGTYDPDPYHMTTEDQNAFVERARRGQWYITPSAHGH